ncbi:DUF559 domain-containing protein [Propioniciclava coleopterorum]|uniref:DUF559 domain-containing protein n=1 Tax=Propioniciclava coleopterorum TaxID=2714937 RepID=A0A6G7Y5R0_9ACTN|nr:DUF559 domain-containing protein [Propioniciclava coleopterorum]QIK71961.1 DUF559 domain-containing protein [Propioniciclava coleopterorum]
MKPDLRLLFDSDVIVTRRDHPQWANQLTHGSRVGEIVALLPGVYCRASVAAEIPVRLLAVIRADPNSVLTHGAAALAGYDPHRPCPSPIVAAAPHRASKWPLAHFERRRIPAEWTHRFRGLRFTHPAWTALDLAATEGPRAIDEALRLGVPLDAMEAALAARPGRRGNLQVRDWLAESRDRPFSFAERAAHLALRDAGVEGWRGNLRLRLSGRDVILDIAFEAERLAVEIDGFAFHSSAKAFNHDRLRDADLMAAGWAVLRLPASLVLDEPDRFVRLVRRALSHRGRGE